MSEHIFRIEFQPSSEALRPGADPLLILRALTALGEPLEAGQGWPEAQEVNGGGWRLRLRTSRSEADLWSVLSPVLSGSRITIASAERVIPLRSIPAGADASPADGISRAA